MRPTPIAPTLIRLLGEVAPNTDAGTIAGKLVTTVAAAAALPATERNERRVCVRVVVFGIEFFCTGDQKIRRLGFIKRILLTFCSPVKP